MSESWEPGNDHSRAITDQRLETESNGETHAADDVLCEWIERLENELAKRDTTIQDLKKALDDPDAVESFETHDEPRHTYEPLAETLVEVVLDENDGEAAASYRIARHSHSPQEQFHRIEQLEGEIARRDELIHNMRELATGHEANLLRQKSEWDHLHLWVEQVEQRIEQSGYYDAIFNADPLPNFSGKGTSGATSRTPSKEDWELERAEILVEIETLKQALATSEALREAAELHARALEERPTITSPEIAPLDPDLWELEREKENLIGLLQRERNEFDELRAAYDTLLQQIEIHEKETQEKFEAMRLELQESAQREQTSADLKADNESEALETTRMEPDERIRAFRMHLDNIHSEESASRTGRRRLLRMPWFRSRQ